MQLEKYIGKTVYIEVEPYDKENETDEVIKGGEIFESLEDVKDNAVEGDEFIEITITKQYKALNQVFKMVEIK